MAFNVNNEHLVSSLSYAKHKYFHGYSNSLADLLMLIFLINEECMKQGVMFFTFNYVS